MISLRLHPLLSTLGCKSCRAISYTAVKHSNKAGYWSLVAEKSGLNLDPVGDGVKDPSELLSANRKRWTGFMRDVERYNPVKHRNKRYSGIDIDMFPCDEMSSRRRMSKIADMKRQIYPYDDSFQGADEWEPGNTSRDRRVESRQEVARNNRDCGDNESYSYGFSASTSDDPNESIMSKLMREKWVQANRMARGSDIRFGDLNKKSKLRMQQLTGANLLTDNEPEDDSYIRLSNDNKGGTYHYEVKIEKCIKQSKVEEAEDLFDEMVYTKRIRPTAFIYGCLIQGYAKQGDLNKSFRLFNEMKKMGATPDSHVYTSLFTACSNCSDKMAGLKKATNFLGLIREKGINMDGITYKAAVRTFGICGDIKMAFSLADEAPREDRYDYSMMSSLLIACCSDKTSGFQMALAVWRSMRKHNVTIHSNHYNLLLRCLNYCGSGELSSLRMLIQHQVASETKLLENTSDESSGCPAISGPQHVTDALEANDAYQNSQANQIWEELDVGDDHVANTNAVSKLTLEDKYCLETSSTAVYDKIADILNPKLKFNSDIEIRDANTPTDRLIMLGGVQGILRRMEVHRCVPDVKTFFYLLRALPKNTRLEDKLLSLMQKKNVLPDISFYTHLLLRRAFRKDYKHMEPIVEEIAKRNLQPDDRLYSILSMSRTSVSTCKTLLDDMEKHGVTPSLLTFKCMMLRLAYTNIEYQNFVLEAMQRFRVKADEEFLRIAGAKIRKCKQLLVTQEKGFETDKKLVNSDLLRDYECEYKKFAETANT